MAAGNACVAPRSVESMATDLTQLHLASLLITRKFSGQRHGDGYPARLGRE